MVALPCPLGPGGGAAYLIALPAGIPVADDLLLGSINVDEVSASAIDGTAMYRAPGGEGDLRVDGVRHRFHRLPGPLAHELTHASIDKAATGFGTVDRWREELAGYRSQGRYRRANHLSILAMLVEQRAADNFAWWGYIEEINRTSPNGLSLTDFSDAVSYSDTDLDQRLAGRRPERRELH
jgi:hypothetical protein